MNTFIDTSLKNKLQEHVEKVKSERKIADEWFEKHLDFLVNELLSAFDDYKNYNEHTYEFRYDLRFKNINNRFINDMTISNKINERLSKYNKNVIYTISCDDCIFINSKFELTNQFKNQIKTYHEQLKVEQEQKRKEKEELRKLKQIQENELEYKKCHEYYESRLDAYINKIDFKDITKWRVPDFKEDANKIVFRDSIGVTSTYKDLWNIIKFRLEEKIKDEFKDVEYTSEYVEYCNALGIQITLQI